MAAVLTLVFWSFAAPLRPYVPPTLEPEPVLEPVEAPTVEIAPAAETWDANVFARPHYSAPLAGSVARGERIAVRGQVSVPRAPYCDSNRYYALAPFGYLCADDAKLSHESPSTQGVLPEREDSALPYRYVMVVVEEEDSLPMWSSVSDLWQYAEPERTLSRGDTVAVDSEVIRFEDERYYLALDGKVFPARDTYRLGDKSAWRGEEIGPSTHLPFGWVRAFRAPIYDAPKGKKIDTLSRRERVEVLAEEELGRTRWLRIGEGRYMRANHVNEVRKIARPEGTEARPQWFDVDLGEQVLVAYRGETPVYATLTSSGRSRNSTPRGNYPVWGKVATITMKSQAYDDHPYYVDRVPWVLFFQAHNALHGAYWHDRFGNVKSHGCVNLSPEDAKYVFKWLDPALPPGWSAVRYWDLTQAPVVHVRNSRLRRPFVQERPIGPPDPKAEAERLEQALLRREREALEAAAADAGVGVEPPAVQASPALQSRPASAFQSIPAYTAP